MARHLLVQREHPVDTVPGMITTPLPATGGGA